MNVVVKAPAQCSSLEIGVFTSFVLAGGEVTTVGLPKRIASAKALVFGFVEGLLAGIASLKQPTASYRSRVSQSSGVKLEKHVFPYELGWVYVGETHRGKGLSVPLASAAINVAGGAGVFATSAVDNAAMHAALRRLGFKEVGAPYSSGTRAIKVLTRVPA